MKTTIEKPDWLTPEQVAKMLQISKASLCRLTQQGKIPHKRIGERMVRYSRVAIEAWLREDSHGQE